MESTWNFKDYLSLNYDVDIIDITQVKNVMRVVTDKGHKCLKRMKFDRDQSLFILSALKHLHKKGFDSILPFIPTKEGNVYIELENGFGYMTDWIESRECNYSNPVELRMAAVMLSKLHKASEDFVSDVYVEGRMGWGKWIQKFTARVMEMEQFKEIIKNKGSLTYFDRLYIEYADYFIHQGICAIEHLKDTKYFELTEKEKHKKSFCHHDCANHNFLISSDFKAYIIDFDYCICDTRLHDLSSLIIRNMRHGNWSSIEKAQYIIDCYLTYGYIEKDEIPVINAFIEFPQDFWQIGLQYYVEKLKWTEEHFNKRLERVVYDKPERQQFIDSFKYWVEI